MFDLVNGKSPLIIGLEVKRYSVTSNIGVNKTLVFKRPTDKNCKKINIYIAQDETGNDRFKLELIFHRKATISSMLRNMNKNKQLNLIKKINRFMHALSEEMKLLLKYAGIFTSALGSTYERVHGSCTIYTSMGRPRHKRQVSLTHVNQSFSLEVQVDLTKCNIEGEKFEIFNIVDMGTAYSEISIVPSWKEQCGSVAMVHQNASVQIQSSQRLSSNASFRAKTLRFSLDRHSHRVRMLKLSKTMVCPNQCWTGCIVKIRQWRLINW